MALTAITPSIVLTVQGDYLTLDDVRISHLGPALYIASPTGSTIITEVIDAGDPLFVTRDDGSIMALHSTITRPWHVGETATPFAITIRHQDGALRDDIETATFTLVNRANNAKLIDAGQCQYAANGVLSYRPTADEMATACLFRAQFTATLTTGYVLPLMLIEGEIEASL
jgi:hypothetical protein